jgi:outer membrane biosynthesis protein TonB
MTDQQRGAYTPQQDAPLQFDARSPAARRPMPMALIASGTLLVMLVAAVAMYYSRGVRGDNEPPRPVGEPVAVLKSAPQAGAQPADADSDAIGAAAVTTGKAPTFAAAPEAPQPRPAPGAAPQKLTVQTVSPIAIPKSDAPPPPPVAVASTAAPVAKPVAVAKTAPVKTAPIKAATTETDDAKPVAVAKAAPAKSAASVKTAATAGPVSGAMVQIGAFSSAALADKGYSDVSGLMGLSIGGKSKHVEPVTKDGHTLYRTAVTGFSDRASATAFCDALKAKGKICFVKG